MGYLVRFDTDDLIYNRYDLIHNEGVMTYSYEHNGATYKIQVYAHDGVAEPNIWGKKYPQEIFEQLVNDLFADIDIYAIKVTRGRNQYRKFLQDTEDIRVPLPDDFVELMNRIARKDRATIRRKLRWLDERFGSLELDRYARNDIPNEVVETYFKWKKDTHGTDYRLTPQEYLDKYYVTDALMMRAGDTDVAVAFYCKVNESVFFENFSYNKALKRYSPGLLMYVKLMEELIRRKCKYNYMGGGNYIYKTRFGAQAEHAYIGSIYRQEIIDRLNNFISENKIENVAFYGFGVCGHDFLQLSQELALNVSYGIDMVAVGNTNLPIYKPDEIPKTDVMFITLNSKSDEVEELLRHKCSRIFYWNDILDAAINDYKK